MKRLCNRPMRLANAGLLAVLLASPPGAAGQEGAGERLQSLLEEVDWPGSRRRSLALDNPADLLGLALRLDRVPALLTAAADERGANAMRLQLSIASVRALPLDADAQSRLEVAGGWVCEAATDNEQGPATLTVVTLGVPNAWRVSGVLPQSVEAVGLLVGEERPLLIAPRLAWRPTRAGPGVSFGMSLLGDLGMDVGLLDTAADARPLMPAEHDLFYSVLRSVADVGAHQLARFAAGNVNRFANSYEADAGDAMTTLARLVRERAGEGDFSVAPLFNNAEAHRGDLLVFDGTVRRALRIDTATGADGRPSRAAEVFGVDHYYELELFPPDSQNLPLVFCVRDLPEGFPLGERLRQPARLAGFFLKRWAYRTRIPKPGDRSADKRQLAPLLVGRAPILLAPPAGSSARLDLVAAGVFVLMMLTLAITLWRTSRGDQAFEDQVRSRLAEAPEQAAGDLEAALAALRGEDRGT